MDRKILAHSPALPRPLVQYTTMVLFLWEQHFMWHVIDTNLCCYFSFLLSSLNNNQKCSCTYWLWMFQYFTTAWSTSQWKSMTRWCVTVACLCWTWAQRWFPITTLCLARLFFCPAQIPEIQIQASTCCFGLTVIRLWSQQTLLCIRSCYCKT